LTQTMQASYIGGLGVVTVGASSCDFTAAQMEPLIDQAIDIANVEAGLSIEHISGTSGSKSASLTDNHMAIVSVMTLILAINAKLSSEATEWTVERRNNCAEMIGQNGALTRRYDALVNVFRQAGGDTETADSIAFAKYTESEDEET
jgi:hypothetical protein